MGLKNYLLMMTLATLTACGGIESTEIPTDEHSMNYHIEFEQKIEKELPLNDLRSLKRYIRRVGQKNIEPGMDIGDALELQKEYEIAEEKRKIEERKTARSKQLKEYKEAFSTFRKEVETSISLLNFKSQEDFDKYISEKIQISLTPLSLKKRYCRKCFKYDVEFEAKVVDALGVSLVDIEYRNRHNTEGKVYTDSWKMDRFRMTEEDNKKIYTSKKALFELKTSHEKTIQDVAKKNDLIVTIKKAYIGGNLFEAPEEFTLESSQAYISRLNARLQKIENEIKSVESDETKLFKYDFSKNFSRKWKDNFADAV